MANETKKMIDKNNIDIVLYHGSCSDGFGSAFIIWYYYKLKFGIQRANELKYIPCYYQIKNELEQSFIDSMRNKNVIMSDFSFKYTQLTQIIDVANTFIILDHHKTAQDNLKNIADHMKIFDMDRSGVGITWDFFFPDQPLPTFLAYIQDRDLWTFKLPATNSFVTYFYDQKFDFEFWETFLNEDVVSNAVIKGQNWSEYQKVMMDKIIKKTSYVIQQINNEYTVVLYNNSSEFKSDIGNKMFNSFPIGDFSCVWNYDLYKNETYYSLRSTDDRMDVSKIASEFGGGGHRNASGIVFKDMVGCLPYERVNDPGVLALLLYRKKGCLTLDNNEHTYSLFDVKEIKPEWLEEKYLNLIKKKCKDSLIIVFNKPSDQIDFNKETNEVIPLREYCLIYNEFAMKQIDKRLQYMVCASKDLYFTFVTSKEFEQIFNEMVYDKNDGVTNYDSDNENDHDHENPKDNEDIIEYHMDINKN